MVNQDPIHPFTEGRHELGWQFMFDANLGAPRENNMLHGKPICEGSVPSDPPAVSKSVTGGVGMLGGGPVGVKSTRQHLTSPESTTAEITAGGTMLHALIPWRGTLHEMHIPQLLPTPVYSDSQSTIFVANSAAAAKLSVWLNRRIKVLREGVDTKEIVLFKISDEDNCANNFTKPSTDTA